MKSTYLVHVVDNSVNDLALEGLEDDSTVSSDELCLATPTKDHALPYVQDGNDSKDVPELTGTCSFYICVEFRFEVLEHARTEVRRMEKDGMREFFLGTQRTI